MTIYEDRQISFTSIFFGVGASFVIFFFYCGSLSLKIFFITCLLISVILFYSLTITITETELIAYFGIGVIKKRIPLESILYCTPTKINIFYGWGIKKVRRGWMFNISGLKVVDLELRNGKRFVIGCNNPQEVCEVLKQLTGIENSY